MLEVLEEIAIKHAAELGAKISLTWWGLMRKKMHHLRKEPTEQKVKVANGIKLKLSHQ